jgi:hypothetical protein
MREDWSLTPSLTREYVNRNEKMKGLNMDKIEHHTNISQADMFANLFALVLILAACVLLLMAD